MSMQKVLGVILGGGRGSRLWPLTKLRAKPAVPIGGKYRLIDIPVSNCLNSGVQQIAILTQFKSVSLNRHVSSTYQFDFFHPGYVQILAAEQTFSNADWYQGTADAIRKQLFEVKATGCDEILILAGDHLYRMDYGEMIEFHRQNKAEVTVAVKPVSENDAHRFGLLKMDPHSRLTDFIEKPQTPEASANFISREDPDYPFLGSMGIYLFQAEKLYEILESSLDDFGQHVLPAAIKEYQVFGFVYDGYWEDIGTMRSFYEANLALARPDNPFRFHDSASPIYTHPRFLPGSRIYDVKLDDVLLGDGCIVEGAEIRNAVIGIRSIIADDVTIQDAVVMGADYYEAEARRVPEGAPPIGIGRGSRVTGAIIDKNARIGKGVQIDPFPPGVELDHEEWSVRDGIVVVPKSAVIPDKTVIGPG